MPVLPKGWRLSDQPITPEGAGRDILSARPKDVPVVFSSRLAARPAVRGQARVAVSRRGAGAGEEPSPVGSARRGSAQFQLCYTTVAAAGKKAEAIAAQLLAAAIRPLLGDLSRIMFAIDDTPTQRYGPFVQGAGVHHNPTPGPANAPHVYGHIWVVMALLLTHPLWGVIALPLLARLYVRKKDLPKIDPKHRPTFATKLEMAVELLQWASKWLGSLGKPLWVVVDGAYAKAPFLKPVMKMGMTVVSRLRKDAALFTVPGPAAPVGAADDESMATRASIWPNAPAKIAAGPRERSTCTASMRSSDTKRFWRRGDRSAA